MRGREDAPSFFPEYVLEHVLKFMTSDKDRNNVSLVCKFWYKVEAESRNKVFIGNCYSVSPEKLVSRFKKITSVTLKGKPRFADFDLIPSNWGADVYPWIEAFCQSYPFLEELKLKRMTVSDSSLWKIATELPNFKSLTLICCDGFTSNGLEYIARHCRSLKCIDLSENKLELLSGDWVNHFQEACTTLVSLNLETIQSDINADALEELVMRCSGLKTLKLNSNVTLMQMRALLRRAPQLTELGTGSFTQDLTADDMSRLQSCFSNCTNLTSLSGFWEVRPGFLHIIYPTCKNLVFLNLSYAPVDATEFADLVSHCHSLQRLWVMATVEDRGLKAVASNCRDLKHLRVFPAPEDHGSGVSEKGLIAISEGCSKLTSILYFCGRMTNEAVMTMAKNCPFLESFRLATLIPQMPDPTNNQSMDEGFGAIVRSCKYLRRLSLSGQLTDKVFEYIGRYGKRLQRLSVAFAGDSDLGMKHVLEGCTNLFKLEIRDSPFGDEALLSGIDRYESMRSLWMSSCHVTLQACLTLAERKRGQLVVEVIKKEHTTDDRVESVYVYRSTAGCRNDVPPLVTVL